MNPFLKIHFRLATTLLAFFSIGEMLICRADPPVDPAADAPVVAKKKPVVVHKPVAKKEQPAKEEDAPAPEPAPVHKKEVNIVFQIEGVLIQRLPAAAAKNFPKSEIITLGNRNYRIAKDTMKIMRRLAAEPGVKLSFASSFPKAETDQLLAAISAQSPEGASLDSLAAHVFSGEDMSSHLAGEKPVEDKYVDAGKQLDLKKVSADLKNTVFIDDQKNGLPSAQHENLFYLQHPYYEFESYAAAKTQADKLKKDDSEALFFPASEDEWKEHEQRMVRAFDVLERGLEVTEKDPSKNFVDAVTLSEKLKFLDSADQGLAALDTHLAWVTKSGKVTGCSSLKNKDNSKLREVPIEACMHELPITLDWKKSEGKAICHAATDDGIELGTKPVENCLKSLPVHYLWVDKEFDHCGAFTKEYVFIQDTDAGKCGDKDLFCKADTGILTKVVKDSLGDFILKMVPDNIEEKNKALADQCDQPFEAVTADDSTEKKYFESLVNNPRATLSDYLHLWYPARKPNESAEPYFFACEAAPWGALQGDSTGLIPWKCRPDVLYSWGPVEKLRATEKLASDGESWTGPLNAAAHPVMFASLSPLSTFSYGPIQIRMKLKYHTKFKSNVLAGAGLQLGEVGVRNSDRYQDFTLNDGSNVESWSYDTPEQYDEIVRDAWRLESGKRAIKYEAAEPVGSGKTRLFQDPADHPDQENEATLLSRLHDMAEAILKGHGKVFYQKGVCRNRSKTFSTELPNYTIPYRLSR